MSRIIAVTEPKVARAARRCRKRDSRYGSADRRDGCGAFHFAGKVRPDQMQTITKDVADGNWIVRFIVTDTAGQKGKAVDQIITE